RVRTNRGDSIYHGLNVKVDRRFTQGLLLRAAYTWSKAIDTGSEVFVTSGNSSMPQNVFDRSGERGLSAFDRRQRFVLTYVYTIPAMPKSDNFALKGVRALLSDWQISGTMTLQSGAPETVSDGFDANGDGVGSDRPNLGNPDAPITSYAFDGAQIGGTPGLLYDGPSFMNSDALVEVSANDVHWIIPGATNASNRYGNVGRNTILTDGTIDSSFSIARSFKLPGREGQQLQFRTELFNPFNHSNLGIPVYNLIDPDFAGRDITAYGSRQIRFWVKYSF
ncbi:MAG TPA: TonB-dependent receptor, partial [Clostridia bacterium]|nr:TonB-dependent receptor [Clostridia bacterium]